MSYDLTHRLFAQRAAADAAAAEDTRREAFLRALDDAGFEVSEWEAQFLVSFLDRGAVNGDVLRAGDSARSGSGLNWWTEGRRRVVDKLRETYAHRLPEFRAHTAAPPDGAKRSFPPHVPGECGYLVRNDDRQLVRCGKPVQYRTPGGLEICEDHKRARDQWRERRKAQRR